MIGGDCGSARSDDVVGTNIPEAYRVEVSFDDDRLTKRLDRPNILKAIENLAFSIDCGLRTVEVFGVGIVIVAESAGTKTKYSSINIECWQHEPITESVVGASLATRYQAGFD